jgi:hypothetical protein
MALRMDAGESALPRIRSDNNIHYAEKVVLSDVSECDTPAIRIARVRAVCPTPTFQVGALL